MSTRKLMLAPALALCLLTVSAGAQLLRSPVVEGADFAWPASYDLAVADVDGDGHPDVVATTSGETRLVLGTPDGPYGGSLPFLGGGGLYACQLPDLNGDGIADVVSAPSTGSIFVRMGLGDGAFGPAQTLATTSAASTFCFSDLDDDGDLDLAAGLYTQTRIRIFPGDGEGGFLAGHDEPAPLSVRRITAGDVDGDGTLDLVVQNHRIGFVDDGQAALLRGTGGGSFADPVLVHTDVIDALAADFTGDGLADIAVTEDGGDVVVHSGDASLTLPVALTLPAFGDQTVLAAGDLDGDGDADLVQATSHELATHLQAPGGGLGSAIVGTNAGDEVPMVLADLDRDGRLDAVGMSAGLGTILAALGNGDGSWRLPAYGILPGGPGLSGVDAVMADLDGDGRQDIVQSAGVMQPSLLHRGGVDGSFETPQVLDLGTKVLRVFADDSTQDGNMDLVVVRTSETTGPGGGVALAVGDGRMGFTLQPIVGPQPKIYDAFPADVDLDGRTDVLALMLNQLRIFLNEGDGGFDVLQTLEFTSTPMDADAADVDHDGDVDLALSFPGSGSATLRVYKQDAGTFGLASIVPMPELEELLLHDLDGDGYLDAVGVAQPAASDGNLLIRHGASDGSFGTLQTIALAGFEDLRSVGMAELDSDAEAELLVGTGNNGEDGHVLVFNLVGGAPLLAEVHTTGMEATRLTGIDANGDGRQDVFALAFLRLFTLTNTTGPWKRLAYPISGTAGDSLLVGEGPLTPGSPLRLSIVGMQPATGTLLVVGLGALNAPFKGGVLVPAPTLLISGPLTDADGNRTLSTTCPSGLPSGLQLVVQAWQPDAAGPAGFSSTNGLRGVVP